MKTESEVLLEKFCADSNLRLDRIATDLEQGVRVPDYELLISPCSIIVEVKEITPNDDDLVVMDKIQRGEIVTFGKTPGERVLNCINYASPQLKARCREGQPGIIVIYDTVGFAGGGYTEPYDILTAMNGLETCVVNIPHDKSISPSIAAVKFGNQNRTTPKQNTTVSAIGVLYKLQDCTKLYIYHNRFAKNKIDPETLRHPNIRHLTMPSTGHHKDYADWVDI